MNYHNKSIANNHNTSPIENVFIWLGYLKVHPSLQQAVIGAISDILQDLTKGTNAILASSYGPYTIFGQFDILFGYGISNIDHGARLFYSILDTLYEYCPMARSATLKDFHRMAAFEWVHSLVPENNLPALAYATIKLDYSKPRPQNELIVHRLILSLEDVIIQKKLGLRFKILSTFSWYEMVVIIHGNLYEEVNEAFLAIKALNLASSVTQIVVKDPVSQDLILPESWWMITQLAPISKIDATQITGILKKNSPKETKAIQSFNDFIIAVKSDRPQDYLALLDDLFQLKSIEYTNTAFYTISNIDTDVEPKAKPIKRPKPNRNKINPKIVLKKLTQITTERIPRRKLMALFTQIRILSSMTKFTYLFPQRLVESIRYLIEEMSDLSDATVQYYIAEISAAVNERLAGAQMDALVGKDLGFIEKHGGFQRLILACEALIQRCYWEYLDKVDKRQFAKGTEPQLFIFFDYGARLSSDIPAEVVSHGIDRQIPIIIRLRMLRYKPWQWITGVRELSKLLFYLTKSWMPLDVLPEDPEVTSFCDSFMRHFLTRDNFKRVLAEELSFYEPSGQGRYKVYRKREFLFINRMQAVDSNEPEEGYFIDSLDDHEMREIYEHELINGRLMLNLNQNAHFFNFLNAYQGLTLTQQREARTFASFTLSLYWSHRQLNTQEDIK